MPTETVDVVVIGMGPGGEDAAARLARAGLAVVGVDARLVGGECPYYACVPTKMMIRAADALGEARRVGELAGSSQVRPDWAPVAARIRAEAADNWDDTVAVQRFEKAGGRFVRGRARITVPGEVTVSTASGERLFRAAKGIVLNPGTKPAIPPIDGLADTPYWTQSGGRGGRAGARLTDRPRRRPGRLRVRPGLRPLRCRGYGGGGPTPAVAR